MLYVMRVVALPIACQAKRSRSVAAMFLLSAVVCVSAVSCARTGLYPGDIEDGEPGVANTSGSSSGGNASSATAAAAAPAPSTTVSAGSPSKPASSPASCQPSPETCNGRDDDCNGVVDDLPPQRCPGAGSRFCVAGRLSECPRRCDVCVPGSVRVCENSFCSYWGEQECAADGQGFGNCKEAVPPPECMDIAKKHHDSKQLEQCCIDNGYCCLDDQDLDGDGNRREMLGACEDIACQ